MPNDTTTKNFGAYLDRTLKIIRHNYAQSFRQLGVNITTEQWVLLDSLYDQNGQSQTELASNSFKNAPTVSRIIDLLCKKDLTERQRFDNDRRRYKIFLTEKGKNLVEQLRPVVIRLRQRGWQGLDDEDYRVLIRILNRIFDNFDSNP